MLDKVVDFVRQRSPAFAKPSRADVRKALERCSENTIIVTAPDGQVTGVAVFTPRGNRNHFFCLILDGSIQDNFRLIRNAIRAMKKPVEFLDETGKLRVLKNG